MRLILPYVFLAAALSLTNCHKADSSPTIDFGAGDGISNRDASGIKNGSQDPTDWTSDATWNERETALFPELSLSLNSPQQPNIIAYTYVYPNPAKQAAWALQANQATLSYTVAAVVVASNYEVVKRFDHQAYIGGHTYLLDYGKLGMNANQTYRLYYILFNSNGLLCKGHGDLRYSQ